MPRSHRFRWLALAVVLLVAGAGAVLAAYFTSGSPSPVTSHNVTIRAVDDPAHRHHVLLDATVYLPQQTPAPAVIISPGFGADKGAAAAQARDLAARGFVVLTYSARGFGHSTGRIALNSPDYEVADARALVDWLARRPDVVKDGPGDPRVGVTGASYGGALSLLLAGTDKRVDAIAPVITYNNLAQALLPDASTKRPLPGTPAAAAFGANGVFKRAWAGYFFASGLRGGSGADPTCGRFRPEVCRAYKQVATTGRADRATRSLLRRNSPATVTGNITVPTLLVQGEHDTLFGLGQADANARQIRRAGGKVTVLWYAGGHDGNPPGARVEREIGDWFAFHLAGRGQDPGTGFSYPVQGALNQDGKSTVRTVTAPRYPGLNGGSTRRIGLALPGGAKPLLNPAGGNPEAVSSLPGIGSALGSLSSRLATDIPGEHARFATPVLGKQLLIAGSSHVRLRISASHAGVLFAKLYDVAPDGTRSLPGSAVAPFRVPRGLSTATVTLPGIVAQVQAGHHLELVVASTDLAYASTTASAVYRVAVEGNLSVPLVPGSSSSATPFPLGQLIAIGGVLLLCAAAGAVLMLRRKRRGNADPALADVPLVLQDLSKTYRGNLRVVDALSFRVERGQVVGLLGPNGAGKTTALRMLLGLVRPTAGQVRAFGHEVRPGAPVLSRIGSFVERPGFLPHVSGLANLRLFWRATGRPADEARMDEALEIADLGDAVHRKVGTYSLGMRQRLAVAQAMLGMPELLVLDEPTNGLDPPQIRDTRDLLLRYAATGRTVLVSSHVLAEVEQTCSHVVVMNRGKLVAAGEIAELVREGNESAFTVDSTDRATDLLAAMGGVTQVRSERDVVYATIDGMPRADVIGALVEAGIKVEQAGPRGRLEDVFLRMVEERP